MDSIKGIISFIFLTLLLYVAGMFALSKVKVNQVPLLFHTNNFYTWKGGDAYQKFIEFDSTKGHQIVFLGSSRAYRHYDPAIFEKAGITSFNLGTSSQHITDAYQIVEHYINGRNTQILMYDLYLGAIRENSIESSSTLIENVSKNEAALDIALNLKDSRALNLYVARRFTENIKSMYPAENYKGKGFCTKNDSFAKKELALLDKEVKGEPEKLKEEELVHLEEFILKCKEKGVQLVLVNSPNSKYYYENQHAVFLSQIQPILAKYDVPFFDYSHKLGLSTQTYFYDRSHMNYEGVKLFNARLIKDLKSKKMVSNN